MNGEVVIPNLILGVGESGSAVLKEFDLGVSSSLISLPSVRSTMAELSRDEFRLGERGAKRGDRRAVARVFKGALDEQVDSHAQTCALNSGRHLDASRLFIYLVFGPEPGATDCFRFIAESLPAVADVVGLQQIHISVVLVAPNVADLDQVGESELGALLAALESAGAKRVAGNGDSSGAIPSFHCAWLLQDRNAADIAVSNKHELFRIAGQALASLVGSELGPSFHSWHGSRDLPDGKGLAFGSFGLNLIRFPYEDLQLFLHGEVLAGVEERFRLAPRADGYQPRELAELIFQSNRLTPLDMAYKARALSNHQGLIEALDGQHQREHDSATRAHRLADVSAASESVNFQSQQLASFLRETEASAVTAVQLEMDGQVGSVGGLHQAVALSRAASELCTKLGVGGVQRQSYDEQLNERIEAIAEEFEGLNAELAELEQDLEVTQNHYFPGHAGAHLLSSFSALLSYVLLSWLLLRAVRSFPFSTTASTAHWVYIGVVFVAALTVAPMINLYFRRNVERRLNLPLVGQLNLAVMMVVLPGVALGVYLLLSSKDFDKSSVAAILAMATVAAFLVMWLLPEILLALWERIVHFARWCRSLVLNLLNAVRKGLRLAPISQSTSRAKRSSTRRGSDQAADVTEDAPRGVGHDMPPKRRARIRKVLSDVYLIQRLGQLFLVTFASIFVMGVVFSNAIDYYNHLPENAPGQSVFSRAEESVLGLTELSALTVLLATVLGVLLLDFIGSEAKRADFRRDVRVAHSDARRCLGNLIDARVDRAAGECTAEVFENIRIHVEQLGEAAERMHGAFLEGLGSARQDAATVGSSALRRVLDESGIRPAFSLIRTDADLREWLANRLGGSYPRSRDDLARVLADQAAERTFADWSSTGAAPIALAETVDLVRQRVEAILQPDLVADFFGDRDSLLLQALADYRAPRWKHTVSSISDYPLRSADFVVTGCDEQIVHEALPESRVIRSERAAEVVLLHAVHGLPIYALPDWPYLVRAKVSHSNVTAKSRSQRALAP